VINIIAYKQIIVTHIAYHFFFRMKGDYYTWSSDRSCKRQVLPDMQINYREDVQPRLRQTDGVTETDSMWFLKRLGQYILDKIATILSVVIISFKNHPFIAKRLSPRVVAAMAQVSKIMAKSRIIWLAVRWGITLYLLATATHILWNSEVDFARQYTTSGFVIVEVDMKKGVAGNFPLASPYQVIMEVIRKHSSSSPQSVIAEFDNTFDNTAGDKKRNYIISRSFALYLICATLLVVMPSSVFVPIIDTIIGAGFIVRTALLGPIWTMLIIAVAWLRFEPLYGILLLFAAIILAVIALVFLYDRGIKRIEEERNMLRLLENAVEQVKDGKKFDEIDFK